MADERPEDRPAETGRRRLDVDAVRELLDLMAEHELAELEIEQDDLAVRLRKAFSGPVPAPPAAAPAAPASAAPPPAAAPADEGLVHITSPMVGTFYAASGPDAAPFVQVGDHVAEDTVVCVIEAMKVFNEIRAETSGTIEKILTANADAVEFGEPMFAVRPD